MLRHAKSKMRLYNIIGIINASNKIMTCKCLRLYFRKKTIKVTLYYDFIKYMGKINLTKYITINLIKQFDNALL